LYHRCAASAALCFSLLPLSLLTTPLAARGESVPPAQLQALSGEYTSIVEPDTPLSVYVDNGKLVCESERRLPTELKTQSAIVFGLPGTPASVHFTLDDKGNGIALVWSNAPDHLYKRTGPAVHHIFHDYQRTEVMIPMRDGVKLHAVILKPADITAPLPFLMQRTPYGVDGTTNASLFGSRPELARAGYIVVAEDIRGRFKSEGQFVMMRPLADHHDHAPIDESTDTCDTIDWLLKNISGNNGRVGVVGTSYPGFLAMMAGIDPHPAVKAISPQAPMIDVWMGDDFFHNGAFRQSYGYDYTLMMESSKKNADVSYGDNVDGYDFFLKRGSFQQDVKKAHAKKLPTWQLFLNDPAYTAAWSSRAVWPHLNSVTVPTLSVGGYYDQEDMWGPQQEYAKLEPHDAKHENFLVLGPWRHGSWASSDRHLGNLDYSEPIGKQFRADIEAKFFAHYLKDDPGSNLSGFDLEDTASFQTGSNLWKRYGHFPPPYAKPTPLHLLPGGQLSWEAAPAAGQTTYVSDPANPVPYRHRPIQVTYGKGSQWYPWLTEDQRFVADRKDLVLFKLPVLKKDLTITGDVTTDIFASTSGSDTDMVVKLIDQYPDDDPDPAMRGYQLMTNEEIFRGRYLSGFDKPAALTPGAANRFKYSLHAVDHVFKAGHIVVIEVQSTWFPLYDRNPQTFVPNIMKAKPSDFKPATITILSGPGQDSSVLLPVVGGK